MKREERRGREIERWWRERGKKEGECECVRER